MVKGCPGVRQREGCVFPPPGASPELASWEPLLSGQGEPCLGPVVVGDIGSYSCFEKQTEETKERGEN